VEHILFLAPGRQLGLMQSWAPIACEEQFENDRFAEVLFSDGRIESMNPKEIQKLARLDRQAKESAQKLMRIGRALLAYAKDHDGKYPDMNRWHELREYLTTEEFAWARQCAYLAGGKTTTDRPNVTIYHDVELMPYGKGTNVLFNDGHVEFVDPERLNELNINKTSILIETRILEATDDFLESAGLDVNSVRTSKIWSEHLVDYSPADPNSPPYQLILDELQARFLTRAAATHKGPGKGSKMQAAPQVLAADGKQAIIKIASSK
jgi:prepilin-type processing-associated H-X9-DG protein